MAKVETDGHYPKKWLIAAFSGVIFGIILVLATLEISHRDIIPFVTGQEKYIVSAESALLGIFIVEALVAVISYSIHSRQISDFGARLRLIVRIVGYLIVVVSLVSIMGSNPALAISVGTVAGVAIAFATQNIVGSVLSAILILNTRMIRVGEEITVGAIKGTVVDINLIHTVISVEDDVVLVPNSVITSTAVRRKRRDRNIGLRNW